jgi:hypothetical protein
MRWPLTALIVLLVASAAGCHRGPTAQEKKIMTQFSHSMKPQCIGRYLIDLPESFSWLNPDLTLYYERDADFKKLEVQVPNYKATEDSFVKAVDAVAENLTEEKLFTQPTKSLLIAQVRETGLTHAVMLRYYSDSSGIGIDHQLHLLIGHTHVLIKASSYEGVSDEKADLSSAVEARMLKLASEIRPVADPEKAGPGFCLGSVVVNSNNDYENADMPFKMSGHPDVLLDVWMDNQANADQTLLQRTQMFNSVPEVTVIRSGDLMLGGIPAQEKLVKVVENRVEYHFAVESRPKEPSLAHESVNMSLTTGKQLPDARYIDSTLTQDEVVYLWDAIIKSLRPRSDAVNPNR